MQAHGGFRVRSDGQAVVQSSKEADAQDRKPGEIADAPSKAAAADQSGSSSPIPSISLLNYEERHEHHQVPDCDKEVQADEKFCYGCGTKLEWQYRYAQQTTKRVLTSRNSFYNCGNIFLYMKMM